jgi:hypothetical protein
MSINRKKKVIDIPVTSRDVTWAGLIKVFPPIESLASDIPAGDGNVANVFLQCRAATLRKYHSSNWFFMFCLNCLMKSS